MFLKGDTMFKRMINRNKYYDQETRAHLNSLSEKELLIEVLLALKMLNDKCDDIARKIVIWSD